MGLPRSAQRTTLLGFAAEQEKRAKKAETTLDRALWRGRWQAFALCAVMQIVVGLIVHFAK
jgi:hypothetical protein